MEKVKDEANNDLIALADAVKSRAKYQSDNPFGWYDIFSEHLKEAIETRNFAKVFGGPDREGEYYHAGLDLQPIKDYVDKLTNLPTEYFEGKIQRAVSLGEFDTAVVPDGMPKELADGLRDKGLNIVTYKKGDNADRRAKLQSATKERDDLRYSRKREEYKLKSASEDIQKTVKTLTDKIPTLKGKVEVVKSETDLPDHLKSEVKSRGFEGTVEGVFDPKDGKVYVVSNNIFGANRVEQVLRHELTHRGIRNVLGDKVKPVFQQIYKQFENTKEMSKVITDYDLNTDKEGGKLTAVDEFIARHGEQYQKQPVIQRMISMIRHELRKMGFSIKWSDKDIMNLAGAALKSEGMGEEIRFSTKGKESKSNLNPFQREQVKTPEFKKWFGKSAVVDENGEPKVVYHRFCDHDVISAFKRKLNPCWNALRTAGQRMIAGNICQAQELIGSRKG